MDREESLKRAVGKADLCELLSCAFSYPDQQLAQAMSDGALASDAQACLADAGTADAVATQAVAALLALRGASPDEVLSAMRRAYTRLYLAPGGHALVFPYESAFLHVASGAPGVPALFRTKTTLDVERCMREAGVVAKNARKEPCDSASGEFEFLSYLYAQQAEALRLGDDEATALRDSQARAFLQGHALAWLPSFMARTAELAEGPYAALAAYAVTALSILADEG